MTLENCKMLLAHYEANGDEENAQIFRDRIAFRESKLPKANEVKSDGKKRA